MQGLSDLPFFVAVAKHKSFTQAGKSLKVSKAAVSKRLSQMQERLGVQLIRRSGRNLSLTEAGEGYLLFAKKSLAAAQAAEDAATSQQGHAKGLLRISAPMSFGRLYVGPLIADFLGRYPQVEIDLVMEDRMVDLATGGFDLAIRGGVLSDSQLVAKKLAPCHNVLCASEKYLDLNGTPEVPQDLLNHNCLHFSYFTETKPWTFMRKDTSVDIRGSGNYRVNNSETLLQAIQGGLGIGRLPTFIAGPELNRGSMVRILADYYMPQQTMYAIYPERRHLPSKVRVFLDYIGDKLGGDSPSWDRGLSFPHTEQRPSA